jgi:hypothetical protein
MNRRLMTMAAAAALTAGAMHAQGRGRGGAGVGNGFQQFGAVGTEDVQWTPVMPATGRIATTGSPVSATEERRTVQTLGDGTVLERSESNLFYRDTQGRTRTEQTQDGKTMIMIVDPVAGFTARLDPASRTARKAVLPAGILPLRVISPGQAASTDQVKLEAETKVALARLQELTDKMKAEKAAAGDAAAHNTTEDLGTLQQNGVPAQGTRTTMIIPAGKIGNNRDIKVVNERWYSNELQMLVKSVNSDPRFGTTTYQLTNVLRSNPDAGLFQIPGDYTVMEGGGRGGRGAGMPGR